MWSGLLELAGLVPGGALVDAALAAGSAAVPVEKFKELLESGVAQAASSQPPNYGDAERATSLTSVYITFIIER